MDDVLMQAHKVYHSLRDDISRNVFMMRLQYCVTGDLSAVAELDVKYRNLSSDIENFAHSIKAGERNFIYGAGGYGQTFAKAFPHLNFESFIDNYREDKFDYGTGLKIQNINEFQRYIGNEIDKAKVFIAICNSETAQNVKKVLLEDVGINEENIVLCIPEYRNNASQYFDFFEPRSDEVFVDCGCYDGATCFRFAGWCGNMGYRHIYSFEPDKNSYKRCRSVLQELGKCDLYPYGIAERSETTYFASNGKEDARMITESEAGEKGFLDVDTIETIALDDFLGDKGVTFIKMDIEGAEWEALLGAEKIIREQRPRLAVSVYHRMEDFVRIPKWLLDIHPDYKIYFRHYSLFAGETVMYAE